MPPKGSAKTTVKRPPTKTKTPAPKTKTGSKQLSAKAKKGAKKPSAKVTKPTPKWQGIENVVAALERVKANIPGMVVTQKAQVPVYHDPTRTPRDVDVLVRYPLGERTFSLGIDAKDHTRPLDEGEMAKVIDIWNDTRLDRFAVVSTSGFTKEAVAKAQDKKVELVTLEEFGRSEFWAYDPGIILAEEDCSLLHANFNFSQVLPSDVATAFRELFGRMNEATIDNRTGAVRLLEFFRNSGIQGCHQLASPPKDQDVFTVQIDMQTHRTEGTVIRLGESTLPIPDEIVAIYRYHRRETWFPGRRFRANNIEMTTMEVPLNGQLVQMSIVAVPQPDGTKVISVSTGPARPKDTKVDRET